MRYFLLSLSVLLLTACVKPEKPKFKGLDNVHIEILDDKMVHVDGDAIFFNPNEVELTVVGADIELEVEDTKVGTVTENTERVIPPQSDFEIPVEIDVPLNVLFDNPLQMLGEAMSMFGGKKYKVRYFGTVSVKVMGLTMDIPVDKTKEVPIMPGDKSKNPGF